MNELQGLILMLLVLRVLTILEGERRDRLIYSALFLALFVFQIVPLILIDWLIR